MLTVSSIILIGLAVLCSLSTSIEAVEQPEVSVEPRANNGKTWRIGYIEGGPYQDYQSVLKVLIHNLTELGWIEKTPFPQTRDEHETQTIWT